MINKSNSSYNNSLLIRDVFQGRLLCDIANEMGQSLTMRNVSHGICMKCMMSFVTKAFSSRN